MSRHSNALTDVFAAYGDDAEAALEAFANVDHEAWSAYVDRAVAKQYHADYASWRRGLVRSTTADAIASRSGQVRLFEPTESAPIIDFRARLVLDGDEYELASLRGHHGADVLRSAAQRDFGPAATTLKRCRQMLALADHIEAETGRLGRDVSVAEALGWEAAA
jgi:hypothetical protein